MAPPPSPSCTPGFSIKRILLEYRHTCGKGATIPTTRSRLPGGHLELRLATWRPPSSCTPGFSIKRIIPEYCPCGSGTHRTLLHNPHTVMSLNFAFAWLSRSIPLLGDTRHRSPVPVYPWGSIKQIFPGYRHPVGQRGNNTHNSHYVPYLNFDFGVGCPRVRTTFCHKATTSTFTTGFSINEFPRVPTPVRQGATIPTTRSKLPGGHLELRLATWRPPRPII